MATCKWCGKTGLFLKVTSNGLCNTCDYSIVSDIVHKSKLINESSEVINQSSNTDTILSRFDFIVENLNSLIKYEQKGIKTLQPLPSESLKIMNPDERDNHIVYGLEKELDNLKVALLELKTEKGKTNKIRKFYLRSQEFKNKMSNPTMIKEIESLIEELQDGTEKNNHQKLGGFIGYFSLEEWWFSEFDKDEREYIKAKVKETINLTEGKIISSSLLKVDFLSNLMSWFRTISDKPIRDKIKIKVEEISIKEPVDKIGYFKGRHYSSYSEDIKDLIRDGNLREAETLLYNCVEATEKESKTQSWGVAPYFYDKLALIYRKQKDLEKELTILERYSNQKHAQGVMPQKLLDRFEKVKQLLAKIN